MNDRPNGFFDRGGGWLVVQALLMRDSFLGLGQRLKLVCNFWSSHGSVGIK
jgi:hypothetical protein